MDPARQTHIEINEADRDARFAGEMERRLLPALLKVLDSSFAWNLFSDSIIAFDQPTTTQIGAGIKRGIADQSSTFLQKRISNQTVNLMLIFGREKEEMETSTSVGILDLCNFRVSDIGQWYVYFNCPFRFHLRTYVNRLSSLHQRYGSTLDGMNPGSYIKLRQYLKQNDFKEELDGDHATNDRGNQNPRSCQPRS